MVNLWSNTCIKHTGLAFCKCPTIVYLSKLSQARYGSALKVNLWRRWRDLCNVRESVNTKYFTHILPWMWSWWKQVRKKTLLKGCHQKCLTFKICQNLVRDKHNGVVALERFFGIFWKKKRKRNTAVQSGKLTLPMTLNTPFREWNMMIASFCVKAFLQQGHRSWSASMRAKGRAITITLHI